MRYILSALKTTYNKDQTTISFAYYSYICIGNSIVDFIEENIRISNKRIFSFVGSLFTLLFFYNVASLFPHIEEPTKNLNVALAFALYGFFYIQYIAIKEDSTQYLNHWLIKLLGRMNLSNSIIKVIYTVSRICINSVITIISLPFQLLEKLSLIFSLTFRLFGNMFGGSIVIHLLQKLQESSLLYHFISSALGVQLIVFCYFGLFEGTIQAFVFTLVLLNNIGMLINKDH